jgi:ammonium transporter, Amt family
MWGGGWLAASDFMKSLGGGYGALDFAGSGVVHMVGGFISLAGAYLVGARLGKYKDDGTPRRIPGHNLTTALFGVFILWFGWYGFNMGSTLAATDLRIAVIAANTTLSAAVGATVAMVITWLIDRVPDPGMTMNGVLAGLVGITAGCAWVSPVAAVIIGGVSGVVVVAGVRFVDEVLHVDDPVGAIAVHGFTGAWGVLALGIFADGTYLGVTGLLFGNPGFFMCQAISVVVCILWSFGTGYAMYYVLKKTIGLRVGPHEELRGSDTESFGTQAYQEFTPLVMAKKDGP